MTDRPPICEVHKRQVSQWMNTGRQSAKQIIWQTFVNNYTGTADDLYEAFWRYIFLKEGR